MGAGPLFKHLELTQFGYQKVRLMNRKEKAQAFGTLVVGPHAFFIGVE
jgi:hypothetical protein